jgi:hypothetical protein
LAGIAGGIAWLTLQTALSAEWGEPGSEAYAAYERYNRLWPLPLLGMALGFAGVDSWQRRQRSSFTTIPLRLIRLGFLAMLAGNVAEFWLFSDYPYGMMNLRAYAWITFLLGMFITLIGLALLGRATLRAKILPKWSGIILLLSLPFEVAVFFLGQRILFVTATLAIVLGALIYALAWSKPLPPPQTET